MLRTPASARGTHRSASDHANAEEKGRSRANGAPAPERSSARPGPRGGAAREPNQSESETSSRVKTPSAPPPTGTRRLPPRTARLARWRKFHRASVSRWRAQPGFHGRRTSPTAPPPQTRPLQACQFASAPGARNVPRPLPGMAQKNCAGARAPAAAHATVHENWASWQRSRFGRCRCAATALWHEPHRDSSAVSDQTVRRCTAVPRPPVRPLPSATRSRDTPHRATPAGATARRPAWMPEFHVGPGECSWCTYRN